MRKFLLLFLSLLLLMLLVLTSCVKQYVCLDGTTVNDPTLCKSDEPAVVQEPPVAVLEKIPSEIQEILDRSADIESLSYNYKRVDRPLDEAYTFWVKGNAVKRELPIQTTVLNKNEMDVVVFETVAKTANAYCESKKYCIKTGDIGAVQYGQYYVNTPLDWKEKIVSAKKVSEAKLFGRKVWTLETNDGMVMWLDLFSGLPLRVEVDGQRHEFQDPNFNRVEDQDVRFLEREQ